MTTEAPPLPAGAHTSPELRPATPRARALGHALLAALAYVPVMLTAPGRVVADTKTYLYLDPGRLLARASSMWDPNIGLGTVTHQNVGYLFPMAPYYWVFHTLGVPAWVSQRLWLGTIYLFAALGILFLMRTLHVRGPGVPVAALMFMLTPYSLDFASRISVILLPWVGLPWMLALVIRALRSERGWKHAAIFAIVVQVVGGVNATALIFAGIVPVLWVFYAVFVTREVDGRRAAKTVGKIGLLTVFASLWWIVGLSIQSGYGLNVLKYTETLETVSTASLPSEVLRGLGYWFFYGRDKLGPWTESSVDYTQHLWLIAVGFAIPVLALLAGGFIRWRHRAFFVVVTLVGLVVAVGAHPYNDPSVLGGWFKSFAESSSFGLALRSTGRAVPLVALGMSVLLGCGINAVARAGAGRGVNLRGFGRRAFVSRGLVLAALVMVLVVVNLPALWNGKLYGENLQRDENVPNYWTQAIAALDARPHDTRVLEIPGADFASYRWGDTVDPITPGLMDRPYVARELIPWGSPASADLLNALDRRLQEGVLDPGALAPIARLMSVGDIVYRADLETDRFDLARALPTWLLLTKPLPNGLDHPTDYGTSLGPPLRFSQLDEVALALAPSAQDPPPVSIFGVKDAPSIVRTAPAASPLIVSGDGEGLVDLAALGALSGDRPVVYSATFAADVAALRRQIRQPGALLVVTDSNRKRGRRWGAIKDIEGATERADQSALATDEADNRLDVFPDAGTNAATVVVSPGAQVSTTRYGNRITYWQEERGSRALDGDTSTAWEFGTHDKVIGERLRLDLDSPITTDHLNLVQRLHGSNDRYLTQLTLTFDGKDPVTVNLDPSSRTPGGQTVTFPRRSFHRVDFTVADTNVGDSLDGPVNNVGLAEIRLHDDAPGAPDVHVDEIVRMPTDLVTAAGAGATNRVLVFEMARSRTVVIPPRTAQDEPALVRQFRVPGARSFSVGGTIRLATAAPDDVLDTVLGLPGADAGGITVTASQHLPGDVRARGSQAFDGDPATAWTTAFGDPTGQWLDVRTPSPVTFDHLNLEVVADGRHSLPSQLQIDAGGQSRTVDVPALTARSTPDATVTVPLHFDPLTGDDVKVTITKVQPTVTTEYHEIQPITMPVALAEVGIPGVQRAALPARLPDRCRTDLLTVDGQAVGVRFNGGAVPAEAGGAVAFELCGESSLALASGNHVVRSVPGTDTGIDVDGLTFGSAAGGAPLALGPGGSLTAAASASYAPKIAAPPRVRVVHNGRTKLTVRVEGATPGSPFWVVLGESNSSGWQATVAGNDAGGSTLVDGYANGWLINPKSANFGVTLEWTPQRQVWIALAISGAALLLCLFLALRRRRASRSTATADVSLDDEPIVANPLRATGGMPSPRVLVATVLGTGLLGAVLVRGWVGLITAALVAAVMFRPRLRGLLTFGAPAALALAGLYTLVQQYRYKYFSTFDWPLHFDRVNDIAWLAVILLVADAVVELARGRSPVASDVPPSGTPPASDPVSNTDPF